MTKFFTLSATCLLFVFNLSSQNKKTNLPNNQFFDERAAIEQAITKGVKASEINGYVRFLKNDFSSKKALAKQKHVHSPYENSSNDVQETVIYLSPNKTTSIGCPNMSFEQYNFNGWSGGVGTTSTGSSGGNPNYTSTGTSIINSAGDNVSVANTVNYHTIMTMPAINPNYLTINGYDSLTCKAVGTQTISEIPFVSPYSFDPVSVRLNSMNANYRACRLKYITTTSSTNQRVSFSYAVVIQNPAGHLTEESPYFKISVIDETTGLPLPGCTSFTFNPKSALPADSLKQSVITSVDPIVYRKWQYYSVDLSSLSPGTNVSISFEVGGCTLGGHWGYAYVDAECGGSGKAYSNMCSGATFANLVAPTGFTSYQWYNSSGIISGATNDTLVVNTPTVGATYTVNMVTPGGCSVSQTVSISITSVAIVNLNSTSSCPGGNSGTASVQANGSNGVYTYTWTSTSGANSGSVVSNSQTATGLASGTYSVLVASTTCGAAAANISVGVSPAYFSNLIKSFCGNSTSIAQPGGTNYVWYQGATLIPSPAGINDTLYINNAISGDKYTVVYSNASGCRDSIAYTLNLVSSGVVNISNIKNVCPSNTNGSSVITLTPIYSAPYNFTLQGPSGVISNSTTSSTTFSTTNLAAGTYTCVITDGNCTYNNVFTINTVQTNFTMTPGSSSSCSPADTARINFNFGNVSPTSCNLSTTGNCSSANSIQIGFGTVSNSNTSYPSVYSNWYKNARHQILYRASELIAAGLQPGKLSSISFDISAIAGTTVYPNFTIKMKCTSENDLTSTTFDNVGLSQVYFSPSVNIATGWNLYQFSTPYEWDGLTNILVDVCSDITTNYTNNSSSPYSITSFASVRWFNSDVTPACMTTAAASSYSPNNTYRPNVKFDNCGASSPSSYTISVSSNGTIVQNYNNDSIKVVPVTTPTADIVYTITVTNPDGGCTASQTFTMSSNLAAYVTYTNASCGSCPNGSVQVIVSCGTGPYSYVWSPGGATTPSVSGLLPGCYTVTVTDATLNSASSQVCVSFSTKLEDISVAGGLNIYPNPSNGIFNLLSETTLDKLDITVINPLGQTIIQESLKNTKQATVDLSKLSKGIYYLKTNTDGGSKLFKLILE